MENNPLKNIVHAASILPFLNIQQAGLEMLLVLVEQPWGLEEINKCPCKFFFIHSYKNWICIGNVDVNYIIINVLISALLDVVFKNCPKDSMVIKDYKKSIIKTLLESDTSKDKLSDDLKLYIQNNAALQFDKTSSQPEVSIEDMAM